MDVIFDPKGDPNGNITITAKDDEEANDIMELFFGELEEDGEWEEDDSTIYFVKKETQIMDVEFEPKGDPIGR